MSKWSLLSVVTLLLVQSTFVSARPQLPKNVSVPELPDCAQDLVEESALFGELWRDFQGDQAPQATGDECNDKYLAFIPSGEQLTKLVESSDNGMEAFTKDELLRHLTLFSHIFKVNEEEFDSLADGNIIVSLNGFEARVTQEGEQLLLEGSNTNLHCETSCMKVFTLEGILAVTEDDLKYSLALRFGPSEPEQSADENKMDESIVFRTFELPNLSVEVKTALENDLDGSTFAKNWAKAQEDINTKAVEQDRFIVIVPSNAGLQGVTPHSTLTQVEARKRIVATHIIVREGIIPQRVLDTISDDRDIVKINLRSENVVFNTERGPWDEKALRINGIQVTKRISVGNVDIFQIEQPLYLGPDFTVEPTWLGGGGEDGGPPLPGAFEIQGLEPAAPPAQSRRNPHLLSAFVPPLPAALSFAMRQMGAGRFASIWLDVKTVAQRAKADREDNICSLPAEVGPCRRIVGRFFHNADTGKCEPFVYGGCEGNDNRFEGILDCSESCVTDPKLKQEVREQVCSLPVYVTENLEPLLKNGCSEGKSTQFHFNKESNQCEEVEYEGCFGTDNLFETLSECEEICITELEVLETIEEQTQEILDQQASSEDICTLPTYLESPALGGCRAQIPKWTFQNGECEPFFYNGCGATDNQFERQEDCLKKCGASQEPGVLFIYAPSDNALEDLYDSVGSSQQIFSTDILLGRKFIFSSLAHERCDQDKDVVQSLNSAAVIQCNNYVSGFKTDTYEVFISNSVEAVTAEELANSNPLGDRTSLVRERSGEVPEEEEQSLPAPSGLVKNLLREMNLGDFVTKWEDIHRIDELEKNEQNVLCTLPKDEGTCPETTEPQTRFFFDSKSGFCKRFSFGGCGGNVNNFATYDDCIQFCGSFKGQVASATFDDGTIAGTLIFTQIKPEAPVIISGHLTGLSDGEHSLYFYNSNFVEGTCDFNENTGENMEQDPQITLSQEGEAVVELEDATISLFGDNSILNQGVAIQADNAESAINDVNSILAENNALCTNVRFEPNQKMATIALVSTENAELEDNILNLSQDGPEAPVMIQGVLFGLTPGKHGFHVHQTGDTGDGCKAAGGHFNPFMKNHGAPHVTERHVGDLGNIISTGSEAFVSRQDFLSTLYPGKDDISGRGIVVHAGEDDLGLGGDEDSLKTGNAGGRVGCGIIEPVTEIIRANAHLKTETVDIQFFIEQEGVKAEVFLKGEVASLPEGMHALSTVPGGDCNNLEETVDQEISLGEFESDGVEGSPIEVSTNQARLRGTPSLIDSPLILRSGEDKSVQACGMVSNAINEDVIVIVPPNVEDLSRAQTKCHLIFGKSVAENETLTTQTGCFQEVTLFTDENGNLAVNKIPAEKVERRDGVVVIQTTAPIFDEVYDSETMAARVFMGKDNGLVAVRPLTLTLPQMDDTLKADVKSQLSVNTFFDIWDRTLDTDLAKLVDQDGTTFTVVTVDDAEFLALAERSGSTESEFPNQELLNRFILANQVIGEKIDPSALTEEELEAKTVGGFLLTISKKNDEIFVNDVKVKAMKESPQGIIFVLEQVINIPEVVVKKALERIAEAER